MKKILKKININNSHVPSRSFGMWRVRAANNLGFTILEVTVVIFIIVLGMVGVLSLATQTIKVANYNKNEFIASQLAQEGVELIRSIRDSNWLISGNSWNTDITDGVYAIDYRGRNSISAVSDIDDANAKLFKVGNYYITGSGDDTSFSRTITMLTGGSNDLSVESNVRWQERGDYHYYTVSTVLYDWR